MASSFYDSTVPIAKSLLLSLRRILTKAEGEIPNANNLFQSRLIEDMNPLAFHVHYVPYQAQSLAAMLDGQEKYAEPSLYDLDCYDKAYQRVEDALRALQALQRDKVNSVAETLTNVERPDGTIQVPIKGVVGLVHIPNMYFYVAMAYAILRKEGVSIGKRDWQRPFVSDYIRESD